MPCGVCRGELAAAGRVLDAKHPGRLSSWQSAVRHLSHPLYQCTIRALAVAASARGPICRLATHSQGGVLGCECTVCGDECGRFSLLPIHRSAHDVDCVSRVCSRGQSRQHLPDRNGASLVFGALCHTAVVPALLLLCQFHGADKARRLAAQDCILSYYHILSLALCPAVRVWDARRGNHSRAPHHHKQPTSM